MGPKQVLPGREELGVMLMKKGLHRAADFLSDSKKSIKNQSSIIFLKFEYFFLNKDLNEDE